MSTQTEQPVPEFMIRIKLPIPGNFAACPSGDTEFEQAHNEVLTASLPEGYEYIVPKFGETWPKDSEGFTYARLRCANESDVFSACVERERRLRFMLGQFREYITKLSILADKC